MTRDKASLVDAAHIREYAETWDNSLGNGLALAKNAHWAFDALLWTVSDDYRVLVAPEATFGESGPEGLLLRPLAWKDLVLPRMREAWPSSEALRWHRERFEAAGRAFAK